jgi:Zn ribbon nucleic-acid-binding protein
MANITQACGRCNKPFLIIEQEQEFLSKKGLPLPKNCPTCRQTRRLSLRGERELYKTKCQKCGLEIIVSYNPQKVKNTILCKKDYEQYYMENDPIIKDPLPEI